MRVDQIRAKLNAAQGFWPALTRSLDVLGFDESYIDRLPILSPGGGRLKYVKDQIWGMIAFEPDELAIIDTPLLQRLRRIAQLGMTFLTYPSAEHSRFAHTLGVSHVVKRLVASISEVARRDTSVRAGDQEYPLFDLSPDGPLARSLVHAALLHDVGHLAFSHAGETAFMSAKDGRVGTVELDEFIDIFREEGFESSLSECLSIAICLSPRFRKFYIKIAGTQDLDSRLNEICSFIGGVPHDPAYPGLANIISGAAVDADKIDYLNRDAKQCGIPVGVDVARIFLNSALVRVSDDQALSLSRSKLQRDGRRFHSGTHFIVNSSGIDTYDELANAKSVLYQRVYLHQLTRNCEQVLAEALRKAMRAKATDESSADPRDILSWFEFGDDELLSKLTRDVNSKQTAMRLLTRNLPKRAFAIYRDACEPFISLHDVFNAADWGGSQGASALGDLDVVYHRQTAWRLFDQLVPFDAIDRRDKLTKLRENIKHSAINLRSLLDKGFSREDLNGDEPYVGFSPRFKLTPINEVLVREKSSIGHSGQWTRSEELANADNVGRGVDYVHADANWRLDVSVACMKVFYDLHSMENSFPIATSPLPSKDAYGDELIIRPRLILKVQDVCARAGIDHGSLITRMHEAAKAGYFGEAERVVPLLQHQARDCRDIATRFASFRGESGWHVTESSVSAFIRQFPVPLRSKMITLLKGGTIIGRGVIRDGIDRLTQKISGTSGSNLVFTRFSPNSGSLIGITLEQERKARYEKDGHTFARSISELLECLRHDDTSNIVFLDDQFATGSQAHAQLLHWAGLSRECWPKDLRSERNIDLSDITLEQRNRLINRKIFLTFLYGTEAGRQRIDSAAKELGFTNLHIIYDEEIPSTPSNIPDDLKSFLENVGYELLSGLEHDDTVDIEERDKNCRMNALGSGGIGSVMTTLSGAPSHALTALWCPGIYRDQPWIPIFLRRGYRKYLVLG